MVEPPIWKIFVKSEIISVKRGEHKKYLKPPPSQVLESFQIRKTRISLLSFALPAELKGTPLTRNFRPAKWTRPERIGCRVVEWFSAERYGTIPESAFRNGKKTGGFFCLPGWFGFRLDPLWKGLLLKTSGYPNHRAPNYEFTNRRFSGEQGNTRLSQERWRASTPTSPSKNQYIIYYNAI